MNFVQRLALCSKSVRQIEIHYQYTHVLNFPPRRRGCSASGNYLLLNIPIMNRHHEGFDQVFEVMTC